MKALIISNTRFDNTKQVAAFDTSYQLSAFLARFTTARHPDRGLHKLGGKRLTAPTTFYVHQEERYPLYEGEIDRARRWAESIPKQLGALYDQETE
jgi:hypothetical protein